MKKCQDVTKADLLLTKAKQAAAIFSQLDQEQTDKIVKVVYEACMKNRVKLAKIAVKETGIGKWEDKVIKNVVGSLLVHEDIKNLKTVGVISDDIESGIMEVAQPIGPILAIIPVTNPTSTVMFKILTALKTRNPIIISPARKAVECSVETAMICYEAALAADAPEDCIQWTYDKSTDFSKIDNHAETREIMEHKDLALIVATGGGGIVKAAYTSGTPAFGVGSGNVPVLIDKTADIPFAVEQITMSKTFDYGTICASEQAIVVEERISSQVMEEFKKQGGYFLSPDEIKAVEKIAVNEKGAMSVNVVGASAETIARLAGIHVPKDTRLLLAQLDSVGNDAPLSSEILCPILAYYVAVDLEAAFNICVDLNFHGGMGHSAAIYSNKENNIQKYAKIINAGRIIVNTPSSQGGVGGIYNKLHTSLTLGCGTSGKNITTDNITARHMINVQRVARRRVNERLENFNKTQKKGTNLFYDESIAIDDLLKVYNNNY
jgi:acetaldehyde dehydrogenase / alcohol dehydrogenase